MYNIPIYNIAICACMCIYMAMYIYIYACIYNHLTKYENTYARTLYCYMQMRL